MVLAAPLSLAVMTRWSLVPSLTMVALTPASLLA
jgi:hypothetical protein